MSPSECKYCGCEEVATKTDSEIVFQCWTSVVLDNGWSQSPECKLKGLEDRIQRATDTLKAAKRYTVSPKTPRSIRWEETVDGIVTDSAAVDEAIAILEGERE